MTLAIHQRNNTRAVVREPGRRIWVYVMYVYYEKTKEMGAPPPLQGMQFGAPPLKIIHLNSVLLGTSSSVQDVPSLPLRQHSSLLIPGM